MNESARESAVAYGVAVASLAAAVLLRWLLDPALGDSLPLVTLFGAVAVAVGVGGYRPALLVVGLGYLACAYLFIAPRGQFGLDDGRNLVGMFAYLLTTAIIVGFGEAMRAAQRRYRSGEAARRQAERFRTTLVSIGDGVICTDAEGRVTDMNAVAEALTGWESAAAKGRPLDAVFRIVNETTRRAVENPAARSLREGVVVGLANHTVLIAKDGTERPIDDSAAPIRSERGEVVGCVLVFRDITERKRAEDATRQAELQLRTITDTVPALIAYADADGRYVLNNRAYERWFGHSRGEITGKHMRDVLGDDAWAVVGPKVAAALGGQTVHYEAEVAYKDGGARWIDATYVPNRTADGGVVGVAVLVNDITDRKRAEAALRRGEELLAFLIDRSPTGFYIVDADFRISHINADSQARAFRNVSPAIGRRLDEAMRILWPEPLATEIIAIFRRTLDTGEPYRSPGLVSPRNDLAVVETYEWQTDRIAMPDGSYGVVCYYYDTTPLRDAERQLRESEERFRAIADNIPQLAWMADAGTDGHANWFNKAWLEYTGTTLEQNRGSGWRAVLHRDHAARVVEKFARHVKASLDWEDTFPLRGKDGTYRWFLSRMKVIRDDSGTVARLFGTNTDVTEQRDMAENLRKLTAELSEADRRKDEFLATLAHELRNPLAPIRNGLQIMRLSGDDGEAVARARLVMERQLEQMVRLVDELMDVSRITRGKLELRTARIDLAVALADAVETSRPLIESMGHDLVVVVPPTPVFVDADATRLGQVFANLLNNAAKYSERGGRIRLTAERRGTDVVVSVADTGVGIPPDMLPTIFEMFAQVDRSLEKSQGGLGIGLTLAKRLVEMHGGSVAARSDGPGKGSEFVVRLPVAAAGSDAQPPTAAGEPARPAGRCRVLVADDNVDAATSLATILRIMGNEVRTANDGAQAVAAAAAFRPDAILLDIGMPKLNGYDACRRIREQSWGKAAVLIALTGWGQDEDKRRSEEAGFDHHMVKPVDPAALEKLLASSKPATA